MTHRYEILMQLFRQQDQVALTVAAIALGILLAYAALNWLPPQVQTWARRIYLAWIMSGFIASFIIASKG